jgi:hypothetical protein
MSRLTWLKRQYRRRPTVAIATTVAGVDIGLGIIEGSFSLALLGIALGIGSGAWSWRLVSASSHQAAPIFLPYASSDRPVIQVESAVESAAEPTEHSKD